jgi:hypothetical protein
MEWGFTESREGTWREQVFTAVEQSRKHTWQKEQQC